MANCAFCGRKLPAFTLSKKCQWCVQHEAAQRGEDAGVQRVEVAPWLRTQSTSMVVTQGIFGINVAVFIAMVLALGAAMLENPGGQDLANWGANYGPYTVSGQWWRLLTCVFLHGSLLHIAFNMWCLWDLGRLTESLYGHWTFACVYLISGISASVASIVWNPGVLSVGASGAIFGLAGALISSYYLGEFSMPRAVIAGTLRSVVIFVGFNLFLGGVMARTDNGAHVGGLVMGLILGALIAKVAPAQDDIGRRVAVLLIGALLVTGGVFWLYRSHAYLAHGRKGADLLDQGKVNEAIAELQKTVTLRPNFAAGHATLSRAYVRAHDYEHAAIEMQRVIELSPQSEDARYRLGLIYLELKDPAKAEDVFGQLLKMNAGNADGHAGMAAALSDQHRNAEALEEYKRVAAIDAGYDGINYNLGVQQARLKQYDDTIASLLKQREAGDDPDNENLLAAVYENKGMQKEAADAKARAAQMQDQK